MRQNVIYLFSYVEKFTNVRTRMAIAAERNDQFATVRYLAESKVGGHTAKIHGSDSRNIVIAICHSRPLCNLQPTW